MREKAKRTFQVPHTYTIIFILMIIVAVMTWVVPSGTFATTEIDGREVTVAGTYEQMDKTFVDGETGKQVDLRQGPGAVLEAPIMAAAEVVAFVFIVGGAFQIITATGAIDAGMRRVVRRFKSKDILVIPIAMLLFALGGSTFGMAEETLPFFAIFLPIMIAMGFDSLTAFMIVFIGAKNLIFTRQKFLPEWALWIILALAGLIQGMFVSGGALLVIYAVQKLRDQQEFRITLSLIWTVLNFIYACIAFQQGHFTGDVVQIIVMCIPLAVVATVLGSKLQKKISQEKFLKLTYVLLLFIGMVLLVTS